MDKKTDLKNEKVKVNFEEALRRTGKECLIGRILNQIIVNLTLELITEFGKFNYFLVILSGSILSTVLLETLSISFILPVAECDLHLSTKDKGILSAIAFAGIIFSSHLWGFLADTQGRKKVMLPTLFITFVLTFISSFVKNFWLLTLLRFLSGFFISGSSATVYAYLGEFHNINNRSRALAWASFVFGIACLGLPILAFFVINQDWQIYISFLDLTYKPWRFFFIVCGLPSLLCGLGLLMVPESPKFTFSQGEEERTLKILARMFSINSGRPAEEYSVMGLILDSSDSKKVLITATSSGNSNSMELLKSMWNQTAPLFQHPHLKNTTIACVIQFCIFTSSNGMYMFFPEILNRMAEFTNESSNSSTICDILDATRNNIIEVFDDNGTILEIIPECIDKLEFSTYEHSFVLEIVYVIGFAIIGLVINITGKLPIIVFVLFGCGVCGISIIFVTIPLLSIYLYVILLACGLVVSVVNASTVDLFPTNLRAMAVCISLMFGRLGSVFGANVVGLLLDSYCNITFVFSGSLLCLSGALAFLIPNISKRHNDIDSDKTDQSSTIE
ncbi:unnamed protein product [Diamesa serratosioi]